MRIEQPSGLNAASMPPSARIELLSGGIGTFVGRPTVACASSPSSSGLIVAADEQPAVARDERRAVRAGDHARHRARQRIDFAGTARFVVAPSQSCDLLLLPQTHTAPSVVSATLCQMPAPNDTTPARSCT